MGRHWGLLLTPPWRTWVCPSEGQVRRGCSCLGHRGSGSTRSSGEVVARAAGNIAFQKDMANSIGQYAPVFSPGEAPWQRSLAGDSLQGRRVGHDQRDPARIDTRVFCLWHLRPSESWVWRWHGRAACGDRWGTKRPGRRLPRRQESWPCPRLCWASRSWWPKWPVFLHSPALSGT